MSKTFAEANIVLWSKRSPLMYCKPCFTAAAYFRSNHAEAPRKQEKDGLVSWVQKQGGYVHPALRLIPSESSGFGLVCTRPVPQGTPLICLPQHLPLSFPSRVAANGTCSPQDILLQLAQLVPEELWALRLGLRLLMERAQTNSFWWPYISNLPQRFNVPIFFTGDELATLQYAPLIYQVKKRCKVLIELAKSMDNVLSKLPLDQQPFHGQEVDAGALGWAMAAVSSRAFQVASGKGRVMLPLIDMCNHSFKPNARIIQQDKEEAAFVVSAEHDLQGGMDILLSYGALSNDQLLIDYGFVVPQNPSDYVELRYDVHLLDAAREMAKLSSESFCQPAPWQHLILKKLQFEGPEAHLQVKVGGPEIVEGRLLAAMRVMYAPDEESVADKDIGMLQSWVHFPVGNAVESKVLRSLIAMCALVLGHFPTTIAEDEVAGKKEQSTTKKLALEFRMAKKQLLVDCMRALTEKLNLISKNGS